MNQTLHAPIDHPPKVLITKIGLDGHDRGSRLIAGYLRDAGMEVIYTGPWQRIPEVVRLAQDEDVELIGISSLATDHLIVPRLMDALRQAGLHRVPVVLGGIVPEEDEAMLRAAGVAAIYRSGCSRDEIVAGLRALLATVRAAA